VSRKRSGEDREERRGGGERERERERNFFTCTMNFYKN
jgi:hypothetical protein